MIVEDGTGLADANSYASEAALDAFAEANGLTVSGDAETALVRATRWIDGHYGARFPGSRTHNRDQGLLWPRACATDREGAEIPDDAVPKEIVEATILAALREATAVNSLAPDVAGGGAVKREEVGALKVEYALADGQPAPGPKFPEIDGLLAGLLKPRGWTIPLLRA